ncbi:MAG: glycosyltransferase [Chloroflexi bacterium]|nr:glycosyltransferase [Chloroflexota bacterium]
MKVSLVFTTLNEQETITALLDSVAAQTRQPDEVVMVDGGSRDRTVALAESYGDRLPLRVLQAPGANISRGRNIAIAAARGHVIACTDAGVRLPPNWLADLVRPIEAGAAGAAGFFHSAGRGTFQVALGAAVLPHADDIAPDRFLPSCRSAAFRKEAWELAGGFPEWLDYCEDLVFDLALRRLYGPFPWVSSASVAFPPRRSLGAFFGQYYRYARGDGKALLWTRRHVARYSAYLLTPAALIAVHALGHPALSVLPALAWGALAAGAACYLLRPYRRLVRMWEPLAWPDRLAAVALVPLIHLTGDLAKMAGYPAGLWWRWHHQGVARGP